MKNLGFLLLTMAVFSVLQIAYASSLDLVFCSQDLAVVNYDVTDADATPAIYIRDMDVTDNSISVAVGNGVGTFDGNFAGEWSGSNTNIEAFFVNASGTQVGAAVRCGQ